MFIDRNAAGTISGAWYSRQRPDQEEVSDGAPELLAFFNPPPTETDYGAAIQAHLEATARARGYVDAVTLISYAASGNAAWAQEAATFVGWRDQVWAYAFQELARVQSGQRTQPTITGLVAELPGIQW